VNNKSSIIEKLQMLRSFVGETSGFSENDLSVCLRQSGFLVDIAAERLITGQYQPSVKVQAPHYDITTLASSATSATMTTPSETKRTTTPQRLPSVQQQQHPSQPSQDIVVVTLDENSTLSKSIPRTSSTTKTSSSVLVTPKIATPTTAATSTSTKKTTTSMRNYDDWKDTAWLLCQRWVSDGINLTRNGSCWYREQLSTMAHTTETNAVLRFRSRNMQGSFPKYLANVLVPLLEDDMISLEASALMEERNLRIGSHVPICLT
jgi:hypothetical protein